MDDPRCVEVDRDDGGSGSVVPLALLCGRTRPDFYSLRWNIAYDKCSSWPSQIDRLPRLFKIILTSKVRLDDFLITGDVCVSVEYGNREIRACSLCSRETRACSLCSRVRAAGKQLENTPSMRQFNQVCLA